MEGDSLVVWHPCAYYLAHAYNLTYCWAHVVKPKFTPMYLCEFAQPPIWKSWWKQSPISTIVARVEAAMNCALARFSSIFRAICFVVEPNYVACLVHLFSFFFLLFILISSTTIFSIVFFLMMFRYSKLAKNMWLKIID